MGNEGEGIKENGEGTASNTVDPPLQMEGIELIPGTSVLMAQKKNIDLWHTT
ncbi:hypothetical protein SLEP1_g60288 [Rubroshorea leprosula]|uniref:Uncharacterized protein n=1 Tax=Rubroshorea leprosula TaxID=152421 RepID=A0AAV5MXV2_9ROSI|nr:hypothetical protein SLEP1_g60288 [Rubroshorea leprosula]